MQRRVKRVVEDVKSAVVAEIETLVCHGLPSETSAAAWSDLMQVLPSADLLLDEMEVRALTDFHFRRDHRLMRGRGILLNSACLRHLFISILSGKDQAL